MHSKSPGKSEDLTLAHVTLASKLGTADIAIFYGIQKLNLLINFHVQFEI